MSTTDQVKAKRKKATKEPKKQLLAKGVRHGAVAAPAQTKRSGIYVARISDDNRKWVAKRAFETGHTTTTIVNKAIECARLGQKFDIEKYEPKYLTRALQSRKNRLEKLQAQAAGEDKSA